MSVILTWLWCSNVYNFTVFSLVGFGVDGESFGLLILSVSEMCLLKSPEIIGNYHLVLSALLYIS